MECFFPFPHWSGPRNPNLNELDSWQKIHGLNNNIWWYWWNNTRGKTALTLWVLLQKSAAAQIYRRGNEAFQLLHWVPQAPPHPNFQYLQQWSQPSVQSLGSFSSSHPSLTTTERDDRWAVGVLLSLRQLNFPFAKSWAISHLGISEIHPHPSFDFEMEIEMKTTDGTTRFLTYFYNCHQWHVPSQILILKTIFTNLFY